ncbi:MAG: nucleotide sugar dehydrogenase [Candidatus Sericytochromatia bacterium]|nr:nucleotide sugar dehydrogenase [Candidatus Sericytochromatia bacterium]
MAARLKRVIEAREATVAVIGIGYVGLPLAVEKAKVGFRVVGLDRSGDRVRQVNEGKNYIADVQDAELTEMVGAGRLRASTDFSAIGDADVVVICVPTPLNANRDPDIQYIVHVAEQMVPFLRPGTLVSLESTTYPGTTEEVLLPILARSGLVVGQDLFVSFSPERVDPGNARYTTRNTNKVVGGVTEACLDIAATFYRQTILDVVTVSSPRVAEMTKVFENTFRAVNIALVNELALLCDRMGLDVWEVVDAANTKPFGMMRFNPGPGVGGHCIPIDPFYLTWKARQYDFHTRFIELAGEINVLMVHHVREKIIQALGRLRKSVAGARILLLGVAYKKDIADWRESPALKLIDLLNKDEAEIRYHDPLVATFTEHGRTWASTNLEEGLAWADCVVIMTDHAGVDYGRVVVTAKVVVDTRNATAGVVEGRERVVGL